MGRLNGCLIYDRREAEDRDALGRAADWREIHGALPLPDQREQAARCMDCGVPFCHGGRILNGMASGCPLGNLIPEFNDLLYRGLDQAALGRLSLTNPLPEMTGRVCPAPCEAACLCGFNQEAITIRANERCLAELGFENGWTTPIGNPGDRGGVAVVGSGPAGLACAIRLRQLGFSVTVFERDDRPGGLLMYGIPNMKLEKSVLSRRVEWMEASGVRFRLNTEVTDIAALSSEFGAVALCCGAREPRDLNVEGRGLEGIAFAADYLTQATKSVVYGGLPSLSASGKDVVIIGGGDTGNDCAATAIRQGCSSVTQLEILPEPPTARQASNPWPEWPRVLKADYGQQEYIALRGHDPRVYEAATEAFAGDDGSVSAVRAKVKGEAREFPARLVLLAMGFLGPERKLARSMGLETDERGRLRTRGCETNLPNVFAAGDMRRGQSLVVWAIREGIEAAEAISAAATHTTRSPA
ncbi:MAG: glutamate synthase subunit beta [Oscillospiraceae bacterium]|jgi:glutamate synthase (NADPH/NADH) small chain|nr:glutamate synthase subunit beta [Oscillospiraceae bacterium]